MIKKEPSQQYYDLLQKIIDEIDEIDKQAPCQHAEPEWWLQMSSMVLRRIERKNRKQIN